MAKSTTAANTVAALRHSFAVYGLEQVVSDNGPQFNSKKFTKFLQTNEVKHSRSSLYIPHPMGLLNVLYALSNKL